MDKPGKTTGNIVRIISDFISVSYVCTNQGCGLFERSHPPLQFPSILLCILVGLEFDLFEAILEGAHIQAPKCFQMRNYLLGLS